MNIPELKPSTRSREYKKYSFEEISRIVKQWLLTADKGHRQLDRDILGIDPGYSKGWQSMGVLHFLGLKKEFKGAFKDFELSDVLKELKKNDQDFSQITKFLEHNEEDEDFILSQNLLELGKSYDDNFEEHYSLRLEQVGETDSTSKKGHSRKEQAILRALLFKNSDSSQCALCNKVLPAEIMIAAHIKPRNKCSTKERKDPNVAMPVCKIGCDDLYERGYLIVDDDGRLKKNESKSIPTELDSFMLQYQEKICTHFNQNTREYFRYKRENIDSLSFI